MIGYQKGEFIMKFGHKTCFRMKATGNEEEVWPHNKNNGISGRIRMCGHTVKHDGTLLCYVPKQLQ